MVLTLKTRYREATTHIVMSPLEFIQRLAALVPRPRLHLIHFHGVLAPNARVRFDIVPNVPVNAHTPSADHAEVPPPAARASMSWGQLLKRVFEIDIEHCPQCGGTLKIIAAIAHSSVTTKILVCKILVCLVIVACMHELLSIMIAVLKSNLPWNPKIA